MTSSPPLEAPHFRGKTLTPESPVPIHVPEPQNIPVLMNQTDLAFNDMSTHMEQRYPPQNPNANSSAVEFNGLQPQLSDMLAQAITPSDFKPSQPNGNTLGGVDNDSMIEGGHGTDLAYNDGATETQQESTISENHLTAQPPVPNGDYDSFSHHAKTTPTSFSPSQSQNPTANITHAVAGSSEDSQTTPVSLGSDDAVLQPPRESDTPSHASGSDVNGDGVNYQALLDNLSPFTATAPISDNITSITTDAPPAPSSPGSSQTPIATLPVPVGLPPRPPPQEKPAIHPNYTPGEDIRSYHNPPAQNSNAPATYNSQPTNPPKPPQGYGTNNGVAPNGLPPPPLATFQQPLPNNNQSQNSPQEPQNRQKDNYGRGGGRPSVSQEGEDEVPRRPEIEKIYEEFLREEAVYVAEGTWDRFPQGSRLFVGTFQPSLPINANKILTASNR